MPAAVHRATGARTGARPTGRLRRGPRGQGPAEEIMARLPRLVVLLVALAAGSIAPGGPAGADTASGVAFLATTQQPNGGWDTSPASEFATTEVILAIAEQAQTGSSWSTAQALAAVDAFDFLGNPANPDPLA